MMQRNSEVQHIMFGNKDYFPNNTQLGIMAILVTSIWWCPSKTMAICPSTTQFYVYLTNEKVRVRMTDASTNVILEMIPPTFAEFFKNLNHINLMYPTSSVICNKQLSVFSTDELCALHQIFKKNGGGLRWSPSSSHWIAPNLGNWWKLSDLKIGVCDSWHLRRRLDRPPPTSNPHHNHVNLRGQAWRLHIEATSG